VTFGRRTPVAYESKRTLRGFIQLKRVAVESCWRRAISGFKVIRRAANLLNTSAKGVQKGGRPHWHRALGGRESRRAVQPPPYQCERPNAILSAPPSGATQHGVIPRQTNLSTKLLQHPFGVGANIGGNRSPGGKPLIKLARHCGIAAIIKRRVFRAWAR